MFKILGFLKRKKSLFSTFQHLYNKIHSNLFLKNWGLNSSEFELWQNGSVFFGEHFGWKYGGSKFYNFLFLTNFSLIETNVPKKSSQSPAQQIKNKMTSNTQTPTFSSSKTYFAKLLQFFCAQVVIKRNLLPKYASFLKCRVRTLIKHPYKHSKLIWLVCFWYALKHHPHKRGIEKKLY